MKNNGLFFKVLVIFMFLFTITGCDKDEEKTQNSYNVYYDLHDGILENAKTSVGYDESFVVEAPKKVVNVTLYDVNNNATTKKVDINFGGWTITGLDTTNHIIGDIQVKDTSVSNTKAISYSNLRESNGTVVFSANWENAKLELTSTKKSGYTCGWSTTKDETNAKQLKTKEYEITVYDTSDIKLYETCVKGTVSNNTNTNTNKTDNNTNKNTNTNTNTNTQKVYTITLDPQGSANAGTKTIYLVYGKNYVKTNSVNGTTITTITKPTKDGYVFKGYFTLPFGLGTKVIDENGKIVAGNKAFAAASTIYAKWVAGTENNNSNNNNSNNDNNVREQTVVSGKKSIKVTCVNFKYTVDENLLDTNGVVFFKIWSINNYDLTTAKVEGNNCELHGRVLAAYNNGGETTCKVTLSAPKKCDVGVYVDSEKGHICVTNATKEEKCSVATCNASWVNNPGYACDKDGKTIRVPFGYMISFQDESKTEYYKCGSNWCREVTQKINNPGKVYDQCGNLMFDGTSGVLHVNYTQSCGTGSTSDNTFKQGTTTCPASNYSVKYTCPAGWNVYSGSNETLKCYKAASY